MEGVKLFPLQLSMRANNIVFIVLFERCDLPCSGQSIKIHRFSVSSLVGKKIQDVLKLSSLRYKVRIVELLALNMFNLIYSAVVSKHMCTSFTIIQDER